MLRTKSTVYQTAELMPTVVQEVDVQLQAAGRWDVYCQVCALGDTGPLCVELWHVLLVYMNRSRAGAVDALLTCASRAPLGADLVLACTRPAPVRCTTTTRLACGRRWWSLTRDDHPPAAAALPSSPLHFP